MASLTADFEAGTLGAGILATDPGSASAWDGVSPGSGNTVTYDATHVAHGSAAAKLVNGGTSGGARILNWTTSLTATTLYFFRFYMYWTANPGATGSCTPVSTRLAGANCWTMGINSSGTITISNQGGVTIATFATTLPLNAWTRVEGGVDHSAGNIEVKLFAGDSITPLEAKTLTAQSIRTSIDTFALGVGSLSTTYWVDDVVANAAAYPGPALSSSFNPAVLGGAFF